jgi:peptidoglycan/xylan/chitin deacetylase (PgdA/CDA1 family)
MTISDDYLAYPKRSHGMDHDRYDWSMIQNRPPLKWPGGANVAVCVMVAMEFFPLDQPAKPFKAPGGMATPYPDLRHYTLRDYGNRVGFYRVMKVLDELAIKPTVAFNSVVAERYPQLVDEVNRRDGEIVAYGVDMGKVHHGGMSVEEETDLVRRCVSSLRQASNQPVTGWWSPARSESMNTLDLVAAEGIEYVCDWINDDLPYPMRTSTGPIHSMPLSHDIDDQTIISAYHQSEAEFVTQVCDAFDTHMADSKTHGGRVFTLTIHPWMSGQPHRIMALKKALSHVMGTDGVWSATASEIIDAFKSQG